MTSLKITKGPRVTFADKLGSIGGTLGLFLGVSIFSFVEVANFLVKSVKAAVEGARHKKKGNKKAMGKF